ncbi:MAG: threonine-phosphate decarboxylase [Maritimibacter harenae]
MSAPRDHGGGLDAAIARFGGTRADWVDLSTGINPEPFPLPDIPRDAWTALPDSGAFKALEAAARAFWSVPEDAAVLAAPGASALIARIPALAPPGTVRIAQATYNEHAAAFGQAGWRVQRDGPADARVVVHPNNPTGDFWTWGDAGARLTVIDESFCDIAPETSHVQDRAGAPGVLILKSLGKFWGLAGLRLGFVIGDPDLLAPLREMLGPWPVSGPALVAGRAALEDRLWADETRARLDGDAARLDALMSGAGAAVLGGTPLFRLYDVGDAAQWQARLAQGRVWSRVFPYAGGWLRLGLPPADRWDQLEAALR